MLLRIAIIITLYTIVCRSDSLAQTSVIIHRSFDTWNVIREGH